MDSPEANCSRPDPLIEEVRAARKDVSHQFDNDIDRLCDYLRQIEAQNEDRVVRATRASRSAESTS